MMNIFHAFIKLRLNNPFINCVKANSELSQPVQIDELIDKLSLEINPMEYKGPGYEVDDNGIYVVNNPAIRYDIYSLKPNAIPLFSNYKEGIIGIESLAPLGKII